MCGCVQNGATAIHVAAQYGHKECIEVLAGLGGDVNKATTVSVEGAAQSVVWRVQRVELGAMVLMCMMCECGRTYAVCRMGPHRSSLQRRTATRSVLRCWHVWAAM